MSELRLRTVLEPAGPAGAIILSDEQVEQLGAGKRAPVRVTIGKVTVPLRIARMGGRNMVGMSKAARAAFGIELGDDIDAVVAVDDQPREVDLPPALAAALAVNPELKQTYDALAYTHRKEYAVWIDEAKRDETRTRRVAQALEMLREGKTRS